MLPSWGVAAAANVRLRQLFRRWFVRDAAGDAGAVRITTRYRNTRFRAHTLDDSRGAQYTDRSSSADRWRRTASAAVLLPLGPSAGP